MDSGNKERVDENVKKKRTCYNPSNSNSTVLDSTNNRGYNIKESAEQECKICKKLIPKAQFISHVNEHLPKTLKTKAIHKKQYICSFCNKDMKTKSHLETHLRTHSGKLYYF